MKEQSLFSKHVYIVGAHSRAQTLAVYLQYLYSTTIEAFLYDNDEKNPEQIEGTSVLRFDSDVEMHFDYPVYIATRCIYHERLAGRLGQIGFSKIYPVTVKLDLELRNRYVEKYFESIGRKFDKIDMLSCSGKSQDIDSVQHAGIYVARSVLDRPLQNVYEPAGYEREIQAGAGLTQMRLSSDGLTDNKGDNISDRNQQFCELTALYWLWKHAKEDILGLVHYRRHFILPEDWEKRMDVYGIDVILPVPLYVAPNLEGNYKKRHDPMDWEFMMQYMRERDEREWQEATNFFRKNNLYSPCNMFIMRRDIMDELCEWMFPILFAVAENGGKKSDRYSNRYPGFLAERLMTFFFEKNNERFHIVYSDKNFLI